MTFQVSFNQQDYIYRTVLHGVVNSVVYINGLFLIYFFGVEKESFTKV